MEYVTEREIENLLKVTYAANPAHHLALLLAATTGARTSQLVGDTYEKRRVIGKTPKGEPRVYEKTGEERTVRGLTGTDIDAVQNRVRVHAAKGGKSRFYNLLTHTNPMFDVRTHAIERAKMVGSGRLFSGLTRSYLDKCIKKYGALAGIHPELCHLHAIRHGVGMLIFADSQRPGAITNFLGHSDDRSCLPYLRENDGKFGDQAVAKYWARLAA